jgi:hypothetical protein
VEARALVAAAVAALVLAPPARADDLDRLAPVLVHDRSERFPATSVAESGAPGTRGEAPAPVVYGRGGAVAAVHATVPLAAPSRS